MTRVRDRSYMNNLLHWLFYWFILYFSGDLKLELLNRIDTHRDGCDSIAGVAELSDTIFVFSTDSSNCILATGRLKDIDINTIVRLNKYAAKDLHATDMASCNKIGCLYIFDRNNEVIWRLSFNGSDVVCSSVAGHKRQLLQRHVIR